MPKTSTKKRGRKRLATQSYVKSVIHKNLEMKNFDTDGTAVTVDSSGSIADLCEIGQGDSYNNREGYVVTLKAVYLRYVALLADTYNIVRMIIYRDLSPGGSPLTIGGVFQAVDVTSPLNVANKQRIQVLRDELITLDAAHVLQHNKHYIKFPGEGVKCYFSDTTGASDRKGHIYIALLSDSGAVPHVGFAYYARVKFVG